MNGYFGIFGNGAASISTVSTGREMPASMEAMSGAAQSAERKLKDDFILRIYHKP